VRDTREEIDTAPAKAMREPQRELRHRPAQQGRHAHKDQIAIQLPFAVS
jgi:hypothetical protein